MFKIHSNFVPSGDQPKAINELCNSINNQNKNQVLLGVTGSGKTYTIAKIIEKLQRPSLIMSHNKTLAAQLFEEMKDFFPNNAVEYFVSYYDYYQPEAYIPRTDTYIEKDASINEQIDQYRHSATRSLFERKDVIVVSSVSCIYGLGIPESYFAMKFMLEVGQIINREDLLRKLIALQYERNDLGFERGKIRIRGDIIDIFPSHYGERSWKIELFGDEIERITEFDPITGKKTKDLKRITIYPNSHFIINKEMIDNSLGHIKKELYDRVKELRSLNKIIEAHRLEQRTLYDIEMIASSGTCSGIENYSRYLSGRNPGQAPATLFEYFPKESLLFIDESHASVPQIRAMYHGDKVRKENLVEHGFRLASALDNRPLKFEEWDIMRPQTIFVSATPSSFELELTNGKFIEQVIRPTGLIDPECIIRPTDTQVDDLMNEIIICTNKNLRTLVTTLTKKMAEDICDYMQELGIRAQYLHSDINAIERMKIIYDLRKGEFDVIVGINLLREGLDIPECGLVAILDADKEGFLRSETSLIQTIGRAARNIDGKVILYANTITKSIDKALKETERRRAIQKAYNEKNNITPTTITKSIKDEFSGLNSKNNNIENHYSQLSTEEISKKIKILGKEMIKLASELEFEKASKIRDEIEILKNYSSEFMKK